MGAPFKVLDDTLPLAGDRIDVAVRLGWALRMARLTSGGRAARGLTEMAGMLADNDVFVSSSTLHRVESGKLRLGHVTSAYEPILDLPTGALRAPADILCRTFTYSPADRGVDQLPRTVEDMDALLRAVDRDHSIGGDWLRWARAVVGVGGLGVPADLLRTLVARLASEMGRSAGTAYHARYEALALLRCSSYGELVLDVAREIVADPHVQVLNDLLSMVGECVTDDAVAWAAALLLDDRDRVSFAASLCLENLVEVGGDPAPLVSIAPVLARAFGASEPGADRWSWLSHLVRLMPPGPRAAVRRKLAGPLSPTVRIPDWTRTSLNEHWTLCEDLSRRTTDDLDLPHQPLLARLLFEIAMGPHESRAVTGYMLLRGIPVLGDRACDLVADLAQTHPDALVRERAARRLPGLVDDQLPKSACEWLTDGHPRLPTALLLAGTTGTTVDEDVLVHALTEPTSRRAALYAAGMTGSLVLDQLLADDTVDLDVRCAAAWWREHGERVRA